MRIVDIDERAVPISRYEDPSIPAGGLTTSIVAVTTDAVRAGRPVIGYGFSSVGRFAQSGLIRERLEVRHRNSCGSVASPCASAAEFESARGAEEVGEPAPSGKPSAPGAEQQDGGREHPESALSAVTAEYPSYSPPPQRSSPPPPSR